MNAVIVGGGPAGLAAAIRIRQKGLPVTVIELREAYKRPINVNLRQASLDYLEELGVSAHAYPVVNDEFILQHEDGSRDSYVRHPSLRQADGGRHTRNAPGIMKEDPVMQVRLSELEESLARRAAELGVRIEHGARAVMQPSQGGYEVQLQRVRPEGNGFVDEGPPESLGKPDLIGVCDGANSQTRAQLGIDFEARSDSTYFVGAQVNGLEDLAGTTRKMIDEHGDFRQHKMLTGNWVLVEVDPQHREMHEQEEIREYFCHEASQLAGRKIEPEQLAWGGNYMSFVQNRQANHVTAGDNVVLLGDAARTGFAWNSGGANMCFVDAQNFDQLVDQVATGRRQEGLDQYEWRTRYTGGAWLIAGANEFGSSHPA